jgi:hypothetical protein
VSGGPSGPVSAEEELRALVQRYARAADARDIEGLAALFHPDAVIEGARGVQTREEWLASMAAPRAFPVSMHFIGEPLIEVTGERASVDAYAVVYQVGESTRLTLGVRYVDEVVRDGGAWVIRHRRAETVWMRSE